MCNFHTGIQVGVVLGQLSLWFPLAPASSSSALMFHIRMLGNLPNCNQKKIPVSPPVACYTLNMSIGGHFCLSVCLENLPWPYWLKKQENVSLSCNHMQPMIEFVALKYAIWNAGGVKVGKHTIQSKSTFNVLTHSSDSCRRRLAMFHVLLYQQQPLHLFHSLSPGSPKLPIKARGFPFIYRPPTTLAPHWLHIGYKRASIFYHPLSAVSCFFCHP